MRKMLDLWLRYRKRFAPLIAVIGLIVVGKRIFSAWPTDADICFDGVKPGQLLLYYTVNGERFREINAQVTNDLYCHTMNLSPGRYSVRAKNVADGKSRETRGAFYAPTTGKVKIDFDNKSR